MGTFHLAVNFSGQALGSRNVVTPSRSGPRQPVQSWAERPMPSRPETKQTRMPGFLRMVQLSAMLKYYSLIPMDTLALLAAFSACCLLSYFLAKPVKAAGMSATVIELGIGFIIGNW